MKNAVVSVCAVAVVVGGAGSALAAPFRLIAVQGHDRFNNFSNVGLTTSGTGFFNSAGQLNTSLSPGDVLTWSESANNHRAYDSYFTISPQGPSRLGSADDLGDTLSPQIRAFYGSADETVQSPSVIEGAGSHLGGTGDTDGQLPAPTFTPTGGPSFPFDFHRARGGWAVNSTITSSGINPVTGRDAVFLAQFTLNRGARLSGGLDVTISVSSGVSPPKFSMIVDGPSVLVRTGLALFQPMVLRTYLVATNDDLSHSRSGGNLGSGSGSTQRFGAADVYHLWLEVVPAPGGVALAGLAAVTGLRRRR